MYNEMISPVFPKSIANVVVSRIKCHVTSMVGESSLVQGRWNENDDAGGIFEREEVRVGKLLGSGGFADVFEIIDFELKEGTDTKYGNSQIAARRYYRENARQNHKANFVMKRLKVSTMEDPKKFCLAASDLAVEALFLSNLHHDNILKIRGWATGGIKAYGGGHHDGYFLILDRLSETLEERIAIWRNKKANNSLEGSFRRLGLNNDNTEELVTRTRIAHQIALALKYLHSKNIVFRDLKPNNVGFDDSGTVKIFDFGLSRELPTACSSVDDVFCMSGAIGTVRYMAPEVALSQHYNQKVDTYSWSMLYWSCITLEKPYSDMSRSTHRESVCLRGRRPELSDDIPESIKDVLENSWLHSVYRRFTMAKVCSSLSLVEEELKANLQSTRQMSSRSIPQPTFIRNTSSSIISITA